MRLRGKQPATVESLETLIFNGYFGHFSRELALTSPYFEAIKQKDYEVLFLFEPHDEVVILQLNQFHKKNLVGIEQEIQADKNKDDLIIEGKVKPR